jgi:hypothetical protein
MHAVNTPWLGIAVLWAASCSGPQDPSSRPSLPPPSSRPTTSAPTSRPAASGGTIEGELERKRRRVRIWGEVERIRSGKHGSLPPLTTTAKGGLGDPVTKIENGTRYALTIWFAGPCSHEVQVKPKTTVTAVFCAGTYNLAAMVDTSAFLPLVREQQDFEVGVEYLLNFFVEKQPEKQRPRKRP